MTNIAVLPSCAGMPESQTRHDMTEWLQLIRGEYREMPGLQLTKPQIQRLWTLDADTCDAVLDVLETSHFLRQTQNGMYVMRGA